jgi:hypothetical protein
MVVVVSCCCQIMISLAGLCFPFIFIFVIIFYFFGCVILDVSTRSWHYVVVEAQCNWYLLVINIFPSSKNVSVGPSVIDHYQQAEEITISDAYKWNTREWRLFALLIWNCFFFCRSRSIYVSMVNAWFVLWWCWGDLSINLGFWLEANYSFFFTLLTWVYTTM